MDARRIADLKRNATLKKMGVIGPQDVPFYTEVDGIGLTIHISPDSDLLSDDETVRNKAYATLVNSVREMRNSMKGVFGIKDHQTSS